MARWIAAIACFLAPGLAAQDGPTARAFCDPAEPPNKCPGAECRCTEDVLAVRFERSGGPILEVDDEPGLPIEATVVLETRSMSIQGWTYGVRHDGRALTIELATIDGTDARSIFADGFNATSFEAVHPAPAAGFISVVVLSLTRNVVLPVGSNSLARATYRLEPAAAGSGEGGILIELTEAGFTDNGKLVRPRTLVDGKILVGKPFHRGDPDGDGRISIADAISLLLFLFLSGPSPGCLEAGDADDDGRVDATDPVVILRWLFGGGSSPAPPGPPPAPCGPDPAAGASLGCDAYSGC
jgi:hypothetical protein